MSIISSIRNVIARAVMPKVFQNWSDPDILKRKREENEAPGNRTPLHTLIFCYINFSDN